MTTPPYASPSPAPYGAPAPAGPSRNTAGTISLVFGIVLLVWGFAQMVWQASSIASSEPSSLALVSLVNLIVGSVLAILALAFGLAGLAAAGRSKVAAGIGTGLGIGGVVSSVQALLWPLVIQLFAA